ncbi:O-antigen ligase family protein [Clostridium estertheticum]|uniref:O-antigen ligase family protein n=1 Tax=Clostridium estertheticum TaxID=238834 RepID=UPI001C7D8C13|nr:O-antigen ligase family protein [Clostridium estertheticum]MBX4265972.1 O-antigen ligase family protein [Clostridium estertheticum]MBX4268709.1 O-antigen ligase family protein [Clostridium estertheticum]WLC79090.1 O-antigen ligase family protein [Clostridium estertheticum]WLC90109.1 O-antigen ligase family protein [Clostridium estertheticum]
MEFIEELKGYFNYLKKNMYIILGLYVVIELGLFIKIGTSNILMFLSSIFVTLFVICSLILMFKDFITASKIYAISIPIIPMVLYIMNRLHLAGIGQVLYIVYFAIYLIPMIRGYKRGEFDFSRLTLKYKKISVIYVILLILAVMSSVRSIHVLEAFKLVLLSMVTVMTYSIGMLCYKKNNKEFYKDILFYLCVGVTLSSIPDITVTLYNLIIRGNNQHLYGVLGSNFMLGYTIIVIPFILLYALNKDLSGKYNKIYKLLLLIQIVNFCGQKSRGFLFALAICFFVCVIIDRKNWRKYILISIVLFSCMTFNVMHRWDMEDLTAGINLTAPGGIASGNAKLWDRLINESKNRRPIWALALGMIKDHAYLGVGPGHFKYYYLQYGGNPKKLYIDAHNIILDLVTEFGIVFSFTFMLAWIGGLLKSVVDIFKNKKKEFTEFKWPAIIGTLCLFIYGNITGQSFISSANPLSVVPAFVFTVVMILMIYPEGKSTN